VHLTHSSPERKNGEALHHAMNHVRFMISPELHVLQDGVQDKALNLAWFSGVAREEIRSGECRRRSQKGIKDRSAIDP
jgi:hypothetical protein